MEPEKVDLIQTLINGAIERGKWQPLAIVALVVVVGAIRKGAAALPADSKLGGIVRSKWGGWALNLLTGLAGGLGSAAAAGVELTLQSTGAIALSAVAYSLGAAGLHDFLKDLSQPKLKAIEAQAAAAADATRMASKTDKINALKGGE